jgi:glutathione synthase/RimK-type ligase-like ATP-grasp enzyme
MLKRSSDPIVALATCAALPDLDADDQRLYHTMRAEGISTEIVVWDSDADWSRYRACIIRSTWDYVPRQPEYVAWAEHVSTRTELWNPAPMIRWNSTKAYLKDLAEQGVPIVPTRWLSAGSGVDMAALVAETGWPDVVIKPVVSAGGNDTYCLDRQSLLAEREALNALLAERDVMIQPFMASVRTVGELSLLYVDGRFSHAIRKVPSADEFRVHEHRGGTQRRYEPTPEQRAFADALMQQLPWPALYGRVDLLLGAQGEPLLTELELTEPSMFLAYEPTAAQRFAQAIQARLGLVSA